MTLLTEHTKKGWHEVESGANGRWVAERFYSTPGASSTVLRVEAKSSWARQNAITLRESQLGEASDGPVADVTLPGGKQVTAGEHAGLAIMGTLPVVQEVPTAADLEDNLKEAEGRPKQVEAEATSAAEKLAESEGVDLAQVEGTGEDGRIVKSDVEAAVGASEPPATV